MASPSANAEPAPPPRVLFACTYNATRSPMAQAIAAALGAGRVTAESAGVYSSGPVDPMAVKAMREAGFDLADHRPHSFDDIEAAGGDLGGYALIVALSDAAARQARIYAEGCDVRIEHWPMIDPTGAGDGEEERLAAYRAVRDALERRIRARLRERIA